jgi:hypothetical protein
VVVAHAAPLDDRWNAYPWTPDEELEAAFAGADGGLLVRAHNHLPFHRTLPDGRLLVSVGAVGLALAGRPEAQWALLTRSRGGWRVRHASEPYDVAATLRRFDESGYLEVAGPIGAALPTRDGDGDPPARAVPPLRARLAGVGTR